VPGLRENLYKIRETRRILYDRESRPYFGNLAEMIQNGGEVPVLGPPDNRGLLRQLFAVGTFAVGPNVLNDGAIMMSQETMAEVFGNWWSDRPAFISITLAPGADVAAAPLPNRTLVGAAGDRQARIGLAANTGRETPVGFHHRLWLRDGVMIGMVFIYYAQYRFDPPPARIRILKLGYDGGSSCS
jgi:putative ABC transport system permease protein